MTQIIAVMEGEHEMTPERAVELADLNDAQADAMAHQGFILSARRTRKTAKEWREIAAQLLVQQRAQGR